MSSSKKRYFSTSKKRPARRKTKAFPSEAAFRWLPSLKACAPLAWRQLRLRPIRRHVATFAAFSLPLTVLKQFLRIRNAKSFYFQPEHIRLINYERHFDRLTFVLSQEWRQADSGSVRHVVITSIVTERRTF